MVKKVISGGQTGIDQMGLEVAQSLGYETGGCAPKKFMTENGEDTSLKFHFGLREVTDDELSEFKKLTQKDDRYTARTYINARDSDGTVYFSSYNFSPGSKTTKRACQMFNKPFIMNPNIDSLIAFINDNNIETLNIAGNRGSKLNRRDSSNFWRILYETLKALKK